MNDFRFAIRQLWKSPGFTFAAVTVLALGIGVNTAIFTLLNQMLFEPPSYQRPDEIVQLFSQDVKNPRSFRAFSYPTYRDIREQNSVFSGLFAHSPTVVGLGGKGNTRRASADIVSSNYFSVLGVLPARGRTFTAEEEKPGLHERVAIVSYGDWQTNGRAPDLPGRASAVPVPRLGSSAGRRRSQVPIVSRPPTKAFAPEPAISQTAFTDIVSVIRSMGLAAERFPDTFGKMPEPVLREILLVVLNNQFGPSGGELFSRQGKTDVAIWRETGAVFIGECKFWTGEKDFGEAIEQLLGYLV